MSLADKIANAPRPKPNGQSCSTCDFLGGLDKRDLKSVHDWIFVNKWPKAALYRLCVEEYGSLPFGLSAFIGHWAKCPGAKVFESGGGK